MEVGSEHSQAEVDIDVAEHNSTEIRKAFDSILAQIQVSDLVNKKGKQTFIAETEFQDLRHVAFPSKLYCDVNIEDTEFSIVTELRLISKYPSEKGKMIAQRSFTFDEPYTGAKKNTIVDEHGVATMYGGIDSKVFRKVGIGFSMLRESEHIKALVARKLASKYGIAVLRSVIIDDDSPNEWSSRQAVKLRYTPVSTGPEGRPSFELLDDLKTTYIPMEKRLERDTDTSVRDQIQSYGRS